MNVHSYCRRRIFRCSIGAYRRGAQWLTAISGDTPPSGLSPLAPPRRYACLVWQDYLHLEYLSYFCGFLSF